MNRGEFTGALRQAALCLELNFRSAQPLIYGYLVPVLFLFAFGTIFRGENPALRGEMGQVLTITILGGACFGLPTALVSERQLGVWRCYGLLPVSTGTLLVGALLARLVLVGSAAALQLALARLAYGSAWPVHGLEIAAAGCFVTAALLGLGLLIAALAAEVPAVQAIGQCLFLPMIIIGGVGIPLAALPEWGRRVAAFMPGRYAVDLLQSAYGSAEGLAGHGWSAACLGVIGLAAAAAGIGLAGLQERRRLGRSAWAWLGVAAAGWAAAGIASLACGRAGVAPPAPGGFRAVTAREIAAIRFDGLPGDAEFVSRLAAPFRDGGAAARASPVGQALETWAPARTGDPVQDARSLLALAGIADVDRDLHEGDIARLVFDRLEARYPAEDLKRILAYIILQPEAGRVATSAPELGFSRVYTDKIIRQRVDLYARKLLGRLTGALRDAPTGTG